MHLECTVTQTLYNDTHTRMRRIGYILLTVITALVFGATETSAQQYNIVENDTLVIPICSSGVTIYDNGGPSGNYTNNFDGWVLLMTDAGYTITLTGTYNMESNYDYVRIYQGGTQTYAATGSGTINMTVGNSVLIWMHTDGSVIRSGFEIHATTNAPPADCHANITSFTVSNITGSTATFAWTSTSPIHILNLNGTEIPVTGNSYTATGLSPNTAYTAQLYHPGDRGEVCCTKRVTLRTAIMMEMATKPMMSATTMIMIGSSAVVKIDTLRSSSVS